jgi:predicted permease
LGAWLLGPFVREPDRTEVLDGLEALRRRRSAAGMRGPSFWYWRELLRYPFALSFRGLGMVLRRRSGAREVRGRGVVPRAESVAYDVRHGFRSLFRTPGVSLIAIATIALAIGANTAIFSLADALLLRPLPVPEPDRLVALFHVTTEGRPSYSSFSIPDYEEIRDEATVFAGLAASSSVRMDLGVGAGAAPVDGAIVSGNWFSVLGVTPVAGRAFLPEEDETPGTHPVVVLSEGLWRRRFGAEPDRIGGAVVLNGRRFTVVGVMPDAVNDVRLQARAEFWVPLMMHDVVLPDFRIFGVELYGNRGTHWVDLVGRLREGETLERARTVLGAIARRQAQANPETNGEWSIAALPAGGARLGPPTERKLVRLTGLLAAVVGMVLLIACANVANLLLVKAAPRRKEMGVRLAIGAGRGRLIRYLLTEALVLSALGGALGVALAFGAQHLFATLGTMTGLPGLVLRLDVRVLAFATGLALFTGVVFGLAPALHASAVDLAPMMKDAGLSTPARRGGLPLRPLLVAAQIGICVVLLVGAGLTLRTLWNLRTVPLGFASRNVATATLDLSKAGYDEARARVFYDELEARVRALPGVESAGLALITPFSARRMANDIFWERPGSTAARDRTNVDMNIVDTDWFATMEVPIVRGRGFAAADDAGAPRVAIVNESMAAHLWPGADPVGRTVWSWNPNGEDDALRIVGVVRDGRYYRGWRSGGQPFLFLPLAQQHQTAVSLHVRGATPRVPTPDQIRRVVAALDPALPPPNFRRLRDAMSESIAVERTGALSLALFGLLALVIATIGVYGVVSFSVTERVHEIGLRMALGADPGRVRRDVISASTRPVLAGTALGMVAALALSRAVTSLLFGVQPGDPATFTAVAIVLVAAAALAGWVPARRATRIDPLLALKSD